MPKVKIVEGTKIIPVTKKLDDAVELCWIKDDKRDEFILHNIDHPALFSRKYNETRETAIIFKRFYKNNVLDNGGKPNTIKVFKLGGVTLSEQIYFESRHSFDYPEIEKFLDVETILWRMYGYLHKFNGPAKTVNENKKNIEPAFLS